MKKREIIDAIKEHLRNLTQCDKCCDPSIAFRVEGNAKVVHFCSRHRSDYEGTKEIQAGDSIINLQRVVEQYEREKEEEGSQNWK